MILGLKDQVRGSVGSIMDNIAEGFDRGGRLEFIKFSRYCKRRDRRIKIAIIQSFGYRVYTTSIYLMNYMVLADEITKMITSFINY